MARLGLNLRQDAAALLLIPIGADSSHFKILNIRPRPGVKETRSTQKVISADDSATPWGSCTVEYRPPHA